MAIQVLKQKDEQPSAHANKQLMGTTLSAS